MVAEDGIEPPTRGFSILLFSNAAAQSSVLSAPGVFKVYSGIEVDLHLSSTCPHLQVKESSSFTGTL